MPDAAQLARGYTRKANGAMMSASRGSAAAVLDFAITRLLPDDATLDALPAVLTRLVAAAGVRAALAVQPSARQPPTILAMRPPGAADPALLAELGALTWSHREASASTDPIAVVPGPGGQADGALLAYAAPVAGQRPCALVLIGDAASWTEEIRVTAHAVAELVAARIRHSSDTESSISPARLALLVADEHGRISYLNESFGTLFGIETPGQLVGEQVADVMHHIKRLFADPGQFVRRMAEVFGARQSVSGEQIGCADGRTVEWDYWPMRADGKDSDFWLAWDISDREATEAQRGQLIETDLAARRRAGLAPPEHLPLGLSGPPGRLQSGLWPPDATGRQLLAAASQELREPLAAIVSSARRISATTITEDDRIVDTIGVIERNAAHVLRLVDDLLLLNRLDSGAIPLEGAPVSIPALVRQAVKDVAADAAEQGVTVQMSASRGPKAAADRLRLRRAVDNLIVNAVKFSNRGGSVRVAADWDGRGWRIDVADSGIGIPAAEMDQLFGRFFRASNAGAAGLAGTGLGLAISKAIIDLHGGDVTADSSPGRGTTLSVYLPAHR